MKRKVVRHGKSTLIVSLPNKWTKLHGVTQGQELDVEERGKELIVSTDFQPQELEVTQDITDLDRTSIMYAIRGYYRRGYTAIHLEFKEPTTEYFRTNTTMNILSVVHEETARLIGFEVLDEGTNHCTITDLQGVKEGELDQVQRRIFILLNQTAKDLSLGAKEHDLTRIEMIKEKHDTITKFASYCMRLINKGDCPPENVMYLYHINGLLDRITDCLKYAAQHIVENNLIISPEGIAVFEEVANGLEAYSELFYKYSVPTVLKIIKCRYKAESIIDSLSAQSPNETRAITEAYFCLELLLDLVEARTALEK